jgi:membrane peptidoglycan carboxypeptidase
VAADPFSPNRWSTLGKLVGALIAMGVLAAGLLIPYVGGAGLAADRVGSKFLDTTCNLQETRPPQKTTLYARDGKTEIATLFTQDRVPIPLSKVPKYLQDALVATEDRRFFHHHGVDLRGLVRSAVSTGSGDTQGGSTLTMQYVKQMRYYQASEIQDAKKREAAQQAAIDVNLKRKMEDAKCALYFENTVHESKAQILDNYLNIAFFGENSYGIEVAAETYFHKHASELSLGESALLVGLLRAPTTYDPFLDRQEALQRRNQVLQNLVAVGKLSQAAADKEKATPIALATQSPPQVKEGCASGTAVANSAFFCEYVKSWLSDVNGISSTTLQTGGLKVVTTLDPKLQDSMQKHITDRVPASSPMTAVMPAVDPKTGDILAMAASKTWGLGRGQTEQSIFTENTAQGASTFKLFALLTALSTGIPKDWPLQTVGNGAKFTSKSCPGAIGVGNGDANEDYNALETLKSATAKSDNTYFIGLTDSLLGCHLQPVVDIMQKLGMTSLSEHDPNDNPKLTYAQNLVTHQRGQQLVLGSVPTSPLELAGAYAGVANGGVYNAPAPVLSISDSDGNALPVKRAPGVRAVAPQVAAQAVDILTGDTKGDGTSQAVFSSWNASGGSPIAGKTGTNQAAPQTSKNAGVWFVGMTPHLVAATGVINFDQTSAPSSGLRGVSRGAAYGDFAAKVWWDSLRPSLQDQSWQWTDPNQVAGEDVPDVTGKSFSDARTELASQGFKIRNLDAADGLQCDSSQPFDTVGYYGPHKARAGSVITVCLSTGVPQYSPPVIVTHPRTTGNRNTGHGNGNGNGNGGTRNGNGNGNGGTGNGGGTNPRPRGGAGSTPPGHR